jgi:hypothetical protein
MSIKSTYGIKKEVAIQVIMSYLFKASDEELGDMLEILPESRFRNYSIDGTGFTEDDYSNIESVEEFFRL